MMNKEEYEKEIIRMWDSLRVINKGGQTCSGVICDECPLHGFKYGCKSLLSTVEVYGAVEKWSNEHPQKHKISKLEYDILKIYSDNYFYYFYESELLKLLLKKGCFKGANEKMNIAYYFDNCEVEKDDE